MFILPCDVDGSTLIIEMPDIRLFSQETICYLLHPWCGGAPQTHNPKPASSMT
jgi:hypothetical protein